MTTIHATVPLSIEQLKQYFDDKDTRYIIDYTNSQLKSAKLLMYISNLDLPLDVVFDLDTPDGRELLHAYMSSHFMVSIPSLELAALDELLAYRFGTSKTPFYEQYPDIIHRWERLIDSLTVYNMYTINDDTCQAFARSFPHETFRDPVGVGINFVNLLKYDETYAFLSAPNNEACRFFGDIFTSNTDDNASYIFKGKNLFHFWAVANNPMFLFTIGVASGQIDTASYAHAVHQLEEEPPHVTSV